MAVVNLTTQQIITSLQTNGGQGNAFLLGATQFTFSIPGAGAVWSGYAPGSEPFSANYSVVSNIQATAFRQAIASWDELISPDFSEITEAGGQFGEIRVAFTAINDPGTAAYAYSGTPQAPGGSVGDVWLNSDTVGDDFSPGTQGFDTFVHEIGHTLGLKHPFDPPVIPAPYDSTRYTVMSYTAAGYYVTFTSGGGGAVSSAITPVTTAGPMVVDIAAVQEIYGVETTTRTGDNTYTFTESDSSLHSIYDAGGTDTLDLSAFTRTNIVDLRPGGYSSIGFFSEAAQKAFWKTQFAGADNFIDSTFTNATQLGDVYEFENNLGIAFTTVIENAYGGSANDEIGGNAAANLLRGNDGNDTIEGREGNDTIEGGAGTDTAVFSGNRANYVASVEGAGFRLVDQRAGTNDGSDFATGVEQFKFADQTVAAANLVPANSAPVSVADGPYAATEDTKLTVAAAAGVIANDTDADADTLTAQLVTTTTHGTLALAADGSFTYTPTANYNGPDSFAYQAKDPSGALSATQTVTINVAAVNDPPDAVNDSGLSTPSGTPLVTPVATLLANDTDVDGDTLSVTSVQGASHGTVGLAGGNVTFTPDGGYAGPASYSYTISDGQGGSDTATVTLTVGTGVEPRFRLVGVDGFVGSVKGSGDVFGTNAFQDITILAGSGAITLDGSFARGDDIVRMAGNASTYTIAVAGANAVLTSATGSTTIPLGAAGLALVFDDGVRKLFFDAAAGSAKIGAQAFSTTAVQITAATDGFALPTGADPAAIGRLVLAEGGDVSVAGNVNVFGTNGVETLRLLDGNATLDGSFGRGGDMLFFPTGATAFSAYIAGSQVVLLGNGDTIAIPAGATGTQLDFLGDSRTLRVDLGSGNLLIGAQAITGTSAGTANPLSAPGAPMALELIGPLETHAFA